MQLTRTHATWSAPGRVNLIGEHLDYNGGPVLPFAIDRRTTVTVSLRGAAGTRVRSGGLGTAELPSNPRPGQVEGWARYVAGALWAFADMARPLPALDIRVSSTVPVGAGLSSSAAIECAVLCCLDDLTGSSLSRKDLALLALRGEREFVGVPCGPMDQFTAMLAQPDRALLMDTRTLDTCQVPLDPAAAGLTLVVVNTGVQHAHSSNEYADRQASCQRAARELGVRHLTEATPSQVDELADPVLRRRARHVVSETARVGLATAALGEGRLADVGPLLTASHASLATDYEVSGPELDTAVTAAGEAGALGARLTGGGFGGSVIVLCRTVDADSVTASVRRAFSRAGYAPPECWAVSPAAGARRPRR